MWIRKNKTTVMYQHKKGKWDVKKIKKREQMPSKNVMKKYYISTKKHTKSLT